MARKLGAWFLIGLSAFMFLGFLMSSKDHSFLVDLVQLALFVAAPFLGGVHLLRGESKQKKRAAEESRKLLRAAREKELLELAATKNGTLTVPVVVRETSLTAAEAEDILHEFIVKRIADVHTAPDGQAVYEFPEFSDMRDFERRRIESALTHES